MAVPEPIDALTSMRRSVTRSRRTASVALPTAFIRRADGHPTATTLLAARRGGGTQLRLYLLLVMQASRAPYDQPLRTTRSYAGTLGLSGNAGLRRVRNALDRLLELQLLSVESAPPRKLQLLAADSSGDPWVIDRTARYVSIPLAMWSNGWLLRLSGRAIAVYVALRELTGGRDRDGRGELLDGIRKRQYGLSDDTWTRSISELRELGLLETTAEIWGDDLIERRRRLRYHLTGQLERTAPTDWPEQ